MGVALLCAAIVVGELTTLSTTHSSPLTRRIAERQLDVAIDLMMELARTHGLTDTWATIHAEGISRAWENVYAVLDSLAQLDAPRRIDL